MSGAGHHSPKDALLGEETKTTNPNEAETKLMFSECMENLSIDEQKALARKQGYIYNDDLYMKAGL
jgi:hypothetical protein